jgi:hypothetical protein
MLKLKSPFAAAALIVGLLLAACGPNEAQQAATSTQIAADIFATQTAGAPTITPTFTPSATPTRTPTSTPTVTLTPTPSDTPTPTATPAPALSVVAPTLDDLPAGFAPMDEATVSKVQKSFPEDSFAVGFSDENKAQAVLCVLIPFPSRVEQMAFDSNSGTFVDLFMKGVGATTGVKALRGFEEIGDSRLAKTATVKTGNLLLRWDVVVFRRGPVGVLLFLGYPSQDKPAITLVELAQLVDKRSIQFTANNPTGFVRDGSAAWLR